MIFSYLLNMQSHPSWVCGLKLNLLWHNIIETEVTPFVGVWIETADICTCRNCTRVTPFVGVWIETAFRDIAAGKYTSHPSWVCGLKLWCADGARPFAESHPSWVCGLKLTMEMLTFCLFVSHPSWVCGLKQGVVHGPVCS